jgi:hypothetical protein
MQLSNSVFGLTMLLCAACCAGSSCELIHLPLDGVAQQGRDSLIRSAAAGCFRLSRGPHAVHLAGVQAHCFISSCSANLCGDLRAGAPLDDV